MEIFSILFGFALVMAPPFYIGYRIGLRRGQRTGIHTTRSEVLADGLSWRIEIVYADASGSPSTRQVTVHRVVGNQRRQPDYIEGYCHLRREARTFSVARIKQLTNLTTGVVSDKPRDEIATVIA